MGTGTIKGNRQWKGYESKTGTNAIDISGLDFEELYIVVATGSNKVGIVIPKTAISSNDFYRLGGYASSGNAELVIIGVNLSQVVLNSAFINGNEFTSTAITSVYYR